MKRGIGYVLLFLWITLAGSLQLALSAIAPTGGSDAAQLVRALVPDLMTLVLVASVGRFARRDVVMLALVAAAARATWTIASPFALIAGCLVVALLADGIRRFAELDRASLRFCAAGAGSLALSAWLLFVDFARASEARARGQLGFGGVEAADLSLPLATALVTALAGVVLWPFLGNLPGLRRLERRAF
ncbi:MAG: hypothetical protein AAGA20_17875 [Planctomycetota bacterium]